MSSRSDFRVIAGPSRRAARFGADQAGSLSVLMLFLVPAIILIFAAALDISKLNAQRRYVQAQADLAALSAVRHLPDSADSRVVAGNVVWRNGQYGPVTLTADDVVFGNFIPGSGLQPAADQAADHGLDAVDVTVRSRFHPILLAAILSDRQLWVVQHAVATRRDTAAFTLRNSLLRFDSSDSVLDAILADELQMNASLLSYEGLATTYVSARELAGLVNFETGIEVLTFSELLDAQLSYHQLLGGLAHFGFLPLGAVGTTPFGTMRLGDILSISPQVTSLYVERSLPDLRVSVFDLLLAAANLSGKNTHHLLNVGAGLNAAPLADPALELDLIDPGVTVFGLVNGTDPLIAEVAQIRLDASASLAGLAEIELEFQTAAATAELLSLNCDASSPEDILARFRVEIDPATLYLHTALLSAVGGETHAQHATIPIAGSEQFIDLRLDQVGVPVPIDNQITLSAVATALSQLLTDTKTDVEAQRSGLGGLLSPLLAVLLGQLNSLVSTLGSTIADFPLIDGAAQALLDLLGLRVAPADLIFHGYGCSSALVQ
ncbi:pilus assembly protein TadG-related protein [Frigidibacter sp. ROC022]|uniref:pilus assembly protein TadG-related protein n=1 Tax=Frigidibacter sp. ROC022 TaxID=2971796 RepID=UPI00215A7256|nr:pilus assembly protein TadG-related protein [Frigidibacter sp. ROC022]MCR8725409.1 pilus assembly protein TadG-related protein [Frigidibacter sp. ROC022]